LAKSSLAMLKEAFELVLLPLSIISTVLLIYGYASASLDCFWRGFTLAVLLVLVPMAIINLFTYMKSKQPRPVALRPQESTGEPPLLPTTSALTVNVEFPTDRWGLRSPVKMTVTGGTHVADIVSRLMKDYALQGGPFYVHTGRQTLGPDQYHQSLGTLGIRDGQKITVTDRPLKVRCKNCGYVHASMIQMTPEVFRTSILRDNSEQCPRCGKMSTYNKEDYFFR